MSDASARRHTMRSGLLLLLARVVGYLDAVSYLGLGRVFTANMTGNTVLLGLALVQADRPAALRAGLALAGFLLGSACAAWLVERQQAGGVWPRAVTHALTLEWGLLLRACWLPSGAFILAGRRQRRGRRT
jgi:uncharacterized membrane protein YoaK (UPF0700 family)